MLTTGGSERHCCAVMPRNASDEGLAGQKASANGAMPRNTGVPRARRRGRCREPAAAREQPAFSIYKQIARLYASHSVDCGCSIHRRIRPACTARGKAKLPGRPSVPAVCLCPAGVDQQQKEARSAGRPRRIGSGRSSGSSTGSHAAAAGTAGAAAAAATAARQRRARRRGAAARAALLPARGGVAARRRRRARLESDGPLGRHRVLQPVFRPRTL